MKLFLILSVVLASTLTLAAQEQTAEEIINKNIDAMGGRDAFGKLKSLVMESEVSVAGMSIPTTTTILYGKGFKSVTNYNGMDIIQCYTDSLAWVLNPMMGQSTAEAMTPEQTRMGRLQFELGGPAFNYQEKGYTAEYLGRDSVGTVSAFKVMLTKPGNAELTMFFDPDSYYLLRLDTRDSADGQEVENSVTYSDFRKTDMGIVMPYNINTTNMGYEISVSHSKLEFNKEIDPGFFDMPK